MMDVHSVIGGAGYVGERTRRRYCSFTDGHRASLLEANESTRAENFRLVASACAAMADRCSP